ncbi:MAG TPA: hypothetical protein VE871_13745 [Longimicrobium sp.]|nr:hypothetical protein [Longimicrobium sp.]
MPLQQARAGAAKISMHIKAAYVLVPLALVFGAAFLSAARGRSTATSRISRQSSRRWDGC